MMLSIYGAFFAASFVLIIVSAIIGYYEARRLTSNNAEATLENIHKYARYLYPLAGLSVLVMIIVSVIITVPSLLIKTPLWFDLYAVPGLYPTLSALFSFLLTLAYFVARLTGHAQKNQLLTAAVLIIAIMPYVQNQYTRPIYSNLTDIKNTDGVYLQSDGSSCAAASGANIARVLGISKTEKEIATLMGTTKLGTSFGQSVYGMNKLGVKCNRIDLKDVDIMLVKPPAMLSVDHEVLGKETHAVAFLGFKNNRAEVLDPLIGRVFFSIKDLNKIWHGNGLECAIDKK